MVIENMTPTVDLSKVRIEYKTVDLRSNTGQKKAEKMHKAGWKTGAVGISSIQFYREVPKK